MRSELQRDESEPEEEREDDEKEEDEVYQLSDPYCDVPLELEHVHLYSDAATLQYPIQVQKIALKAIIHVAFFAYRDDDYDDDQFRAVVEHDLCNIDNNRLSLEMMQTFAAQRVCLDRFLCLQCYSREDCFWVRIVTKINLPFCHEEFFFHALFLIRVKQSTDDLVEPGKDVEDWEYLSDDYYISDEEPSEN
jgi:hypothetical protein